MTTIEIGNTIIAKINGRNSDEKMEEILEVIMNSDECTQQKFFTDFIKKYFEKNG